MFVAVARLTLDIPAASSLKSKRQVLRRITDRVKARFNVSVAEVAENDTWQRAVIGLSVVGNERRNVQEQIDKIIQFVDDLYVAPLSGRRTEVISLSDSHMSDELPSVGGLPPISTGERSLAEAEGLGEIAQKPQRPKAEKEKSGRARKMTADEVRARARALRNPREWEKK